MKEQARALVELGSRAEWPVPLRKLETCIIVMCTQGFPDRFQGNCPGEWIPLEVSLVTKRDQSQGLLPSQYPNDCQRRKATQPPSDWLYGTAHSQLLPSSSAWSVALANLLPQATAHTYMAAQAAAKRSLRWWQLSLWVLGLREMFHF